MEEIFVFINNNFNKIPMFFIYSYLLLTSDKMQVREIMSKYYKVNTFELEYNYYHQGEIREYRNFFREQTLIKYENKCVISGVTRESCLEPTFIKPLNKCTEKEKSNINNVLLMWVDLQKYFENYDFTISPETHKVVVNNKCKDYEWLKQYEDVEVSLTEGNIGFLMWHYEKFKEGI